jgi:flagellar biosynthetic protein FliR
LTFELAQLETLVMAALWPLARVSGLLLTAPILGSPRLPARVRIGLALVLTVILMPLAPSLGTAPGLSLSTMVTVGQQIVVGAAMGFALQLVFEALSFAGELVAGAMGLAFAEVAGSEHGHSVPAIGQFYVMLATLLFLVMDGPLRLISLLATGMQHATWGAPMPGGSLWGLLTFAAHLFSGAVLVALPALAAVLVTNMGFGVISRAAPSMNLFSIGFPIAIIVGFIAVWFGLAALPGAFQSLENAAFALIRTLSGA